MTEKREAMAAEILDFVKRYKERFGYRPSQQEIDDFIYSWNTK